VSQSNKSNPDQAESIVQLVDLPRIGSVIHDPNDPSMRLLRLRVKSESRGFHCKLDWDSRLTRYR
jgi:hypothetical protein